MLEFTAIGTVLHGTSTLYWLLAIGAISLALWKGKDWRYKTLLAAAAVAVFGYLPSKEIIAQSKRDAYAREAWAYFKKKCETEAGEKIYKTFTGVKSVLVIKPLPPATEKDLHDQFWYGDPYSSASTYMRDVNTAGILTLNSKRPTGIQKGLDFVEMKYEDKGNIRYQRISSPPGQRNYVVDDIRKPESRFGMSWEDISTPTDREYWVAASRLRIVDLTDNSVVAERIGYLIEAGFGSTSGGRRPWLSARGLGRNGRSCPDAHDYTDQWFITNVLKQEGMQ